MPTPENLSGIETHLKRSSFDLAYYSISYNSLVYKILEDAKKHDLLSLLVIRDSSLNDEALCSSVTRELPPQRARGCS